MKACRNLFPLARQRVVLIWTAFALLPLITAVGIGCKQEPVPTVIRSPQATRFFPASEEPASEIQAPRSSAGTEVAKIPNSKPTSIALPESAVSPIATRGRQPTKPIEVATDPPPSSTQPVVTTSGNYSGYIAFNRGLPLSEVFDEITVGTGSSIWIIDPKSPGKSLTQVTPDEEASSIMPSWGPDNVDIVFASNRDNDGEHPPLDIWIVSPNGGNLRRLTRDAGHNWTPSWSYDGLYIAFASTRNAEQAEKDSVWLLDIFIMDADGSNQRLLADVGLQDEDPVFSADSKTVFFVAEQPECYQLWRVPVIGGPAEALLDQQGIPICGEDPSLSSDGKSVYFWDSRQGRFAAVDTDSGQITGYAWGAEEPWVSASGEDLTYIQDGDVVVSGLDGSEETSLTQSGDAFFPRFGKE